MQRTIVNPLFRDTITFVETPEETGGTHSLHDLTLMPGGKNLPHIHASFTETFTAVKGDLGLQLRHKKIILHPGQSFVVQKNVVHHFFNPGNSAIAFRVQHTPGHKGMEYTLRIMYGLAADGLTNKKGIPKNLLTAALLMEMADSYPAGWMASLKPLLRLLAKRARKKNLDAILFEQYCQ